MQFRNEKLFVKVGATLKLSRGQPNISGRSQLRSHLLRLTEKNRVSDFCQVRLFCCYKQLKLGIANH